MSGNFKTLDTVQYLLTLDPVFPLELAELKSNTRIHVLRAPA